MRKMAKKTSIKDNLDKIPQKLSCSCWLESKNNLVVAAPWKGRSRFRLDKNEKYFWYLIDGKRQIKDYFKKNKRRKREFFAFLSRYSGPRVQLIQFKEEPKRMGSASEEKKVFQIFRELYAIEGFKRSREDLAYYHKKIPEAADHFDNIETTISYLFRHPHPALQGKAYGARMFEKLLAHRLLKEGMRILEVGGGLGYLGYYFLKELKEKDEKCFNSSRYTFFELSPAFLSRQKEVAGEFLPNLCFVNGNAECPPFSKEVFDIVIDNENIADFKVVKLNKERVLDYVKGKISLSFVKDKDEKEAFSYIKKYSIFVGDALPEFLFNLGIFRFFIGLYRILKPGGIASVIEYGENWAYPRPSYCMDHIEYDPHFGHLQQLAKALGFRVKMYDLTDFMGFDINIKVIREDSLHSLNNLIYPRRKKLPFYAYTRKDIRKLLPGEFQRVRNLKFAKVEEVATSEFIDLYKVMVLKKY